MNPKSQRPKREDNTLSLLNAIIDVSNLAKELSSPTPAKAVFGSVSILLTMIKVHFSSPVICSGLTRDQESKVNKSDYVDLGLACVNVCKALHRGMDGKELVDFGQPVREAIGQLTTWVKLVMDNFANSLRTFVIAELWRRSRRISPSGRNLLSRIVHAKNDKEVIATWKSDLNGILRVFNVCSFSSGLLSLTSPPSD